MSEMPERSESEKNRIAEYAYKLWEDDRSHGVDLKHWLTAEAILQEAGEITAQPIGLPFHISFTAQGIPPWPDKTPVWVELKTDNGYPLYSLAKSQQGPLRGPDPQGFAFLENQLMHDGRVFTLQVVAAMAALYRIVLLLEACEKSDDVPPGSFAEPFGQGLSGWRIKSQHLLALLDPGRHPAQERDLEGYLSNIAFTQSLGLSIVSVSLGSFSKIVGQICAADWKTAAKVTVIALGVQFGMGLAHREGELVAEAYPLPAVVDPGVVGRIEARSANLARDVSEFLERGVAAAGPIWPPLP